MGLETARWTKMAGKRVLIMMHEWQIERIAMESNDYSSKGGALPIALTIVMLAK
jgi:hypothetical protein